MQRSTLEQALRSVDLQTYPDIEVLVINAKPHPHFDLSGYAGKKSIRILERLDSALSRSSAANLGLDVASGKYALFLDDDDWIEPEHIKALVEQLECAGEGYIASYSATRCVGADGSPRDEKFGSSYSQIRLLTGNYIPIHSCLFRRTERTRHLRMDESLPLYEDWDFWMQLSAFGEFIFHQGETAVYRLGSGSGFGVDGWGSDAARSAYSALLKKWRLRWTTNQLENIVERARLSYDLEHQTNI